MNALRELGFDAHFESSLSEEERTQSSVGRVIEEQKGAYRVLTHKGAVWAKPAGRLLHEAGTRADLPAAGDFVVLAGEPGEHQFVRLDRVLPRKTCMVRKAVGGEAVTQVIAANVDTVFVVTSLNQDMNERRLERYLMAIWDSGAVPVVVLSKADLSDDAAEVLLRVNAVAMGVAIHSVSATTGQGLDELRAYLGTGRTVALVGSSGVGKSTLINALLGTTLEVQEIGDNDKGRHTTTARSLILVPGGGVIVDTPGMRELMPADDGDGLQATFQDVEELMAACRFTSCRHESEPDCAVQAAIADGTLAESRLASYRKLQKEQAWLARRQDARAAIAERKKWKQITKDHRKNPKPGR